MTIEAKDLATATIFADVPATTLESLAPKIEDQTLKPGAVVFREGDAGTDLFIVIDGEVEVGKKSRSGRETRIAILGPCDSFGEMSMIESCPRSATVRTLGPTRLARIPSAAIEALAGDAPAVYALLLRSVARNLAKRLRTTDGVLADIAANVYAHYPGSR